MSHLSATARFVESLNICENFESAFNAGGYCQLPDDWLVACSDVVGSRKQIARGNYRKVNLVGASAISAVMNDFGHQMVPYLFGGDGAALAFAPSEREVVEDALAKTVTWAQEAIGLELRAAIVPVSHLLELKKSVAVQRLKLSHAASGFAFDGGGIAAAEKLMKLGQYLIKEAPAGSRPNLEGLSCRWMPITPKRDRIVSMIVQAVEGKEARFHEICRELATLVNLQKDYDGNPVSPGTMKFRWPPKTLELEISMSRSEMPEKNLRRKLLLQSFFQFAADFTGLTIGGYRPVRYRKFVALNTDYRKFQDGLMATLVMGDAQLENLQDWLEQKRDIGVLNFGLSIQDSAVLTCFVPSFIDDNHIHFLDGAGGGYAEAATRMSAKAKREPS